MKRMALLVLAAALSMGMLATPGSTQLPNGRPALMRAKLAHSQKLLEALAVEDFPAMQLHARQLKLLSQDASWEVFRGIEYEQQSVIFRRTADALASAAKKRNLDGAAIAYMQMTLSCVSCHKYIRSQTVAIEP